MNTDRFDVDDAPAVLLFGTSVGSGETRLLVRNIGPNTCYLGGAAVDTDGFPLELDEVLNLSPARRQDVIYGICAAAETATIVVFYG